MKRRLSLAVNNFILTCIVHASIYSFRLFQWLQILFLFNQILFFFLIIIADNCVKLTSSQRRTFSSVRVTYSVLAFILRVLRQTLIYFRIYSKFCICNIIWDLQHILVDQSHRTQKIGRKWGGDFLAKNAKCPRIVYVGPSHHFLL